MKPFRKTLPAGTYFLGDPSYVLSDSMYDVLMKQQFVKRQPVKLEGYFLMPGHDIGLVIKSTGDGGWNATDGYNYGADAGMIGLVPKSLVEKLDGISLGRQIKFKRPVTFISKMDCIEIKSDPSITIPLQDDYDDDDDTDVTSEEESSSLSKKKIRKSPDISATRCAVGQRNKGNDGNVWIVKATKTGVHRWQKT